jgi:transposase
MTNAAVEVITSVQRRRRWSAAEKERLVAASLEPDSGVSAVARAAGIHPSQLYAWRRELCARVRPAGFAAVRLAPDPATAGSSGCGIIEIELEAGTRIRITGTVDPATVAATIAALGRGERRR